MEKSYPTATYAHTFFCGHLDTTMLPDEICRKYSCWTRVQESETSYKILCNYYFESFIDSLVEREGHKSNGVYGDTAHLTVEINKQCILRDPKFEENGCYTFDLSRIHLFFFPFKICLFAIETNEYSGVSMNTLTLAHSILKENTLYKRPEETDAEKENNLTSLIEPLIEISTHRSFSDLSKTGNKLKTFQIISTECDRTDELLFELGTLSPIGCVKDADNFFSPSAEYYQQIIDNNSISIFRNWKALAIFDTFTVLTAPISDRQISLWSISYFRLIYIHALYQKTLLFITNQEFRSSAVKTNYSELMHNMKKQEHWYAFSEISYNFLPQLIYKAIDHGLDIASERTRLHEHIEQEAEDQERRSERKLTWFITALTFLTVFSALYDTSSIFKEMLNLSNGSCQYIKTVIIVFIAFISVFISVFIYTLLKKK